MSYFIKDENTGKIYELQLTENEDGSYSRTFTSTTTDYIVLYRRDENTGRLFGFRFADNGDGTFTEVVTGITGTSEEFHLIGLLDSFTRADASDLGDNWIAIGDVVNLVISDNQAAASLTDVWSNSTWKNHVFGPDLVMSVDISRESTGSEYGTTLYARRDNGAEDGYCAAGVYYNTEGAYISVGTQEGLLPNGYNAVALDSFPSVGSKLGFVCNGSTLEAWLYVDGVWSKKVTAETTNIERGSISIEINDTDHILAVDNVSIAEIRTYTSPELFDDFNRADASDLGANWTLDPFGISDDGISIVNNVAKTTNAIKYASQKTVETFGPDLKIEFEIAALTSAIGNSNDYYSINAYARLANGVSNYVAMSLHTGYNLELDASTEEIQVSLYDDSVNFATVNIDSLNIGDMFALIARGPIIEAWYKSTITNTWKKLITGCSSANIVRSEVIVELCDTYNTIAVDNLRISDLMPSTKILDTFRREDAADLGENWVVDPNGASTLPVILNNAAAVSGIDAVGAVWNVASLGPNVAACVTIAVAPVGAFYLSLTARYNTTTGKNYYVNIANGQFFIGNEIDVLDIIDPFDDLTAGDKIGLVCIDDTIQGWVYRNNEWSLLLSVTDSNNNEIGALSIAMWDDSGLLAISDFSAITL